MKQVESKILTSYLMTKLSSIIDLTEDQVLTWEELRFMATEPEEEAILFNLKRYIKNLSYSNNKFEVLKNPNLFALEDITVVNGNIIAFIITYNDEDVLHHSFDEQSARFIYKFSSIVN